MATIVVETGAVVPGANSYVTEADLTTYAADRGVTLTGSADVLLIQAMDYIEAQSFIGTKYTDDQPLQWPRAGVVIDGYPINANTIPAELKKGQMATALAVDAGNDPLATIKRSVKREKVDVVEVEYMDNAAAEQINRTINAALHKLLQAGGYGSGGSFRVVRA